MSDPASAIAAMRTGELDYTGSCERDPAAVAVLTTNPELIVRSNQLVLGPDQIMFNQDRAPFNDYRVRKAISMAFDRKGIRARRSTATITRSLDRSRSSLFGGHAGSDEAEEADPVRSRRRPRSCWPTQASRTDSSADHAHLRRLRPAVRDEHGSVGAAGPEGDRRECRASRSWTTRRTSRPSPRRTTTSAGACRPAFLTADEWLQALYVTDRPAQLVQHQGQRSWTR